MNELIKWKKSSPSSSKERRLESKCDSRENLLFMNMILFHGDMKVAEKIQNFLDTQYMCGLWKTFLIACSTTSPSPFFHASKACLQYQC